LGTGVGVVAFFRGEIALNPVSRCGLNQDGKPIRGVKVNVSIARDKNPALVTVKRDSIVFESDHVWV
jgi:hypothetical protein